MGVGENAGGSRSQERLQKEKKGPVVTVSRGFLGLGDGAGFIHEARSVTLKQENRRVWRHTLEPKISCAENLPKIKCISSHAAEILDDKSDSPSSELWAGIEEQRSQYKSAGASQNSLTGWKVSQRTSGHRSHVNSPLSF